MLDRSKWFLISLRPHQWYKNLLVFAALIFSKNAIDLRLLKISTTSFLIFCLLSGGIYIINDYFDLKVDRLHPIKKKRPLASGNIGTKEGILFALIVIALALIMSLFIGIPLFFIALSLLLLSVLYSFYIKKIFLLDILVIGLGFILRALAGAKAIDGAISGWLILCAFLLSLFLVLSKRRIEWIISEESEGGAGMNMASYKPYIIDRMIAIVTPFTILLYFFYILSDNSVKLYLTIPFVIYGFIRFLRLLYKKGGIAKPIEHLIFDRAMIINLILWFIVVIFNFY